MGQKIENHQASAAFQNLVRGRDGSLRMNGVMQCLAQNRKIDTVFRDWRIFDIAEPVFEVLEAMLFCEFGSEFDHLWRTINCDNFARVFGYQLRKRSLASAKIRHGERWQQPYQSVGQSLPRSPRAISPAAFSRELIEVFARLVLAFT